MGSEECSCYLCRVSPSILSWERFVQLPSFVWNRSEFLHGSQQVAAQPFTSLAWPGKILGKEMLAVAFAPFTTRIISASAEQRYTAGQFCFPPSPCSCSDSVGGGKKDLVEGKSRVFLGGTNHHIRDVPALKGESFIPVWMSSSVWTSERSGEVILTAQLSLVWEPLSSSVAPARTHATRNVHCVLCSSKYFWMYPRPKACCESFRVMSSRFCKVYGIISRVPRIHLDNELCP